MQTRQVALLAVFNTQRDMAKNPTFTRIIRFVRGSFRSDHRVTVSQKKKSPPSRASRPSKFLPVVAPTYIPIPVQGSNILLRPGKYLSSKMESGISR